MDILELWIIGVLILVALNGGLVGTFLVLRRMSMLTDAMSHAVLFGLAIAALLTGSLAPVYMLIGGTIACLLTAYLSQFLQQYGKVQEDASIGIVFTWLFAMGVILISLYARGVHIDQDCVLHGEIVQVPFDVIYAFGQDIGPKAFWILLGVLVINVLLLMFGWRNLTTLSFDSVQSTLLDLQPKLWNLLLLMAVSLTSVASFESVGVILIVSFIVTPAATAQLVARSLREMLLIASLCGITAAVSGYFVAKEYDASISASAAMMSAVIFLATWITTTSHTYIKQRRKIQI